MDVKDLTIGEILAGLKGKEFSATELVEGYLGWIAAVDKKIGAFLTVTEKEAKGAAEEADRAIVSLGDVAFEKRPFLGVPIAYKDLYLTEGVRTTAGSSSRASARRWGTAS